MHYIYLIFLTLLISIAKGQNATSNSTKPEVSAFSGKLGDKSLYPSYYRPDSSEEEDCTEPGCFSTSILLCIPPLYCLPPPRCQPPPICLPSPGCIGMACVPPPACILPLECLPPPRCIPSPMCIQGTRPLVPLPPPVKQMMICIPPAHCLTSSCVLPRSCMAPTCIVVTTCILPPACQLPPTCSEQNKQCVVGKSGLIRCRPVFAPLIGFTRPSDRAETRTANRVHPPGAYNRRYSGRGRDY